MENLREFINRDKEFIIFGEIKVYNVMFMVIEDFFIYLLLQVLDIDLIRGDFKRFIG